MSGQGHQIFADIFADELARCAGDCDDARWAAIARRLTAPVRVAVAGRRGVGRGTVARALAAAGVASASAPDGADMQVYVLAEVVKPEDRAAIAAARHPVLAVLTKADLIGGPAGAVATHGARIAALAGVPTEPMAGLLAVAALDDTVLDDTVWAALRGLAARAADLSCPERFVGANHPVPGEQRRRLLDTLDLFGVTVATAAIRRGMSPERTRALLRFLSRVDAVVDKISVCAAPVRYQRVRDAAVELEALAVTDRRAGDFLRSDEAVIARMRAALDVAQAAGLDTGPGDSPAAHLRRAAAWQQRRDAPVAGVPRACGADIVRGSLRCWSKAMRSP
ncbi:hypothetical protein [Mycobacterium sp.]|uniref:hypothetical protein n=1 Tax=Mycobacterium sp. TaxID=1785 RepID=UPI0031DF8E71